MCIRDNLIFVCDTGFGGVKIFDTDGKALKQFRTSPEIRNLDVSAKKEIYVTETGGQTNPCINVYHMEGHKLRRTLLLKIPDPGDKIGLIAIRESYMRVDMEGNILLLFILNGIIQKYNSTGKLIWERKMDNPIIYIIAADYSAASAIYPRGRM